MQWRLSGRYSSTILDPDTRWIQRDTHSHHQALYIGTASFNIYIVSGVKSNKWRGGGGAAFNYQNVHCKNCRWTWAPLCNQVTEDIWLHCNRYVATVHKTLQLSVPITGRNSVPTDMDLRDSQIITVLPGGAGASVVIFWKNLTLSENNSAVQNLIALLTINLDTIS
jgi:hypothetical protein